MSHRKTLSSRNTQISQQSSWFSFRRICLIAGIGFSLMSCALAISLVLSYRERALPGVMLGHRSLAGKNRAEIIAVVDDELAKLTDRTVVLRAGSASLTTSSQSLLVSADRLAIAEQALHAGKENWVGLATRVLLQWGNELPIAWKPNFSVEQLHLDIKTLQENAAKPGKEPSISLRTSGVKSSIVVENGEIGQDINLDEATALIQEKAGEQSSAVLVDIPLHTTGRILTQPELDASRERATRLVGKQLALQTGDHTQLLVDTQLIPLLGVPQGMNELTLTLLLNELERVFNRPPQEPKLDMDAQTLVVKEFIPPKNGITLDRAQTATALRDQLTTLENSQETAHTLQLTVVTTSPTQSLSALNTLGIAERIGFGDSHYLHSIPGRIHNVALTASRVNNVIVKPGEEFSFNKTLGEVSGRTGFQPAYVIRNGRTELGDGGGVCQVSTTVFRALLNGGLPITKRKAHSYRVSYYELNSKPGVDATVYAGDVDLRFVNDTGHHILIRTTTDSKALYMTTELYGTSDGRTAEIVDHKTWDFVGAPAPLYIDDPSVPRGRIKQVDFAASGIKASFKNVVKDRNGNIIREDTYFSNYRPWRAVFLRGV